MGFKWLQLGSNKEHAEYARAYERAIKTGSIDSVISWELGGYPAADGTIIMDAPHSTKDALRKSPLYKEAMRRVDLAVNALREARTCIANPQFQAQ